MSASEKKTCADARALRASVAFRQTCATSGYEASWCGTTVVTVAQCDAADRRAAAAAAAIEKQQAELAAYEAEVARQAALLAQQQAQAASQAEQARLAEMQAQLEAEQARIEVEKARLAAEASALATTDASTKRYVMFGAIGLAALVAGAVVVRALR